MNPIAAQSLAAKYYLPPVLEMFATVARHGHLLTPAQQSFLATFALLNEDAQCLFLRMASRRHDAIKIHSLLYPELQNVEQALRDLQLCELNCELHPRDWPQLLKTLNKSELQAVLRQDYDVSIKASIPKPDLLALCQEREQSPGAQAQALCSNYVMRRHQRDMQYFSYLYHGKFESCLRLYSPHSDGGGHFPSTSRLGVRFATREQALSAFDFARDTNLSHSRNVGATALFAAAPADTEYAVVDVETTGGRAAVHRITEIAVVRVRADQVVGQWSSLINPQRPIPPMITELTGITDQMVATAPTFADIADELAEQLSGCIFVAHNVSFDYGFIGTEFARSGREFKMPRYCTVRETRSRFPGLPSYSLANLCNQFDIHLGMHHRALDDATAAAQLLLLNLKRSETDS